ncbi:MAG TPA: bifunctional riboflavin kinase/FAD synthetase [Gammaproteobacteria bacterium]|jgi:riboflavin kinase/FMN adenylyltransferase|nr:bifunctional riboflavin kinase/FAD synthetase [Gammaproteobacteria bacterium]HAE70000.1 bifunctional riboflavin kinase/FAD synthetase [Gammaproteobacteria bacterium]HAP05345.1 bifunctional riboflavin kinase/FAD synthetase [Gammaproteobacteria bacterium]HAP92955.1 bifunctional riboflavin kinase/FAD synthetase [Gammaproteobacteria bacterium]HAQ68873.1 bifunctional riboflavin kinase/FAD synthetase [Gammaproteobacteria bacterium]
MQFIRGLHNLKNHAGSVVTIGNFDGVHVGHEKIILRLVESAKALGLPSVLISFSPTPQCFFGREQATLSNFKEKHQLLDRLGVDKHLLIYFNQTFSELKAKDFIQQVLLDKLNMKHCLIGDDFRFGKKRQGDLGLLQSLSKTKGFSVENTQSVLCNDCRASSSEIRTLLAHGDLAAVTQMLGREFSISGKIIHGQQKGRTIGFPTINIPIKRKISPVLGVFATTVEVQGSVFQGVCNIGNRPTINGEEILLEVFLFDFDRDVYGFEAKVVFKHKIRDEEKFDSFKALKQQIELDTQQAKAFFKV